MGPSEENEGPGMSGMGPCAKEGSGVSGVGSGKGDAAEMPSSSEVSNIGAGPKTSAPSLKPLPWVSQVTLVSK